MAQRVTGRFRNPGELIEDLRQVAALSLVKAIDRFDPSRGACESCAVPTITGEIKQHFRPNVVPEGSADTVDGARAPEKRRDA